MMRPQRRPLRAVDGPPTNRGDEPQRLRAVRNHLQSRARGDRAEIEALASLRQRRLALENFEHSAPGRSHLDRDARRGGPEAEPAALPAQSGMQMPAQGDGTLSASVAQDVVDDEPLVLAPEDFTTMEHAEPTVAIVLAHPVHRTVRWRFV